MRKKIRNKREYKGNIEKVILGIILTGTILFAAYYLYNVYAEELEMRNAIEEPSKQSVIGLKNYKAKNFKAKKKFSNFSHPAFKSYNTYLTYNKTGDFFHVDGDDKIKYTYGEHGPAGETDKYAYICMDVSEKTWPVDRLEIAETKFADSVSEAMSSLQIKIIGDASVFTNSSDAQNAAEAFPDEDGIICATEIR